jgi:hypothetical protein
MAEPFGRITASHDAIYPRYAPCRFVERQWLVDEVAHFRDDPEKRHLIIVGEPGSGKTALVAYLAETWNCPRHFIRVDNVGGVTGVDPRGFLLSIGTQLFQKYGREIFELGETGRTKVTVDLAKDQAEIVGRVIDELHSPLPFLSQERDIEVGVGVALGKSKVIGERVRRLVNNSLSLPETTLLHIAVIQPLHKLHELHPDEKVIILIDALDESLHHPCISILDVIAKASDADFPPNLRLVMTSRPGDHLRSFRKQDQLRLDDKNRGYWQETLKDARAYIDRRIAKEPLASVFRAFPKSDADAFVTKVAEESDGNFLYLYHLFNEISGSAKDGQIDLESIPIPKGLDEIYGNFAVAKIRDSVLDSIQFTVVGAINTQLIAQFSELPTVRQVSVTDNQVTVIGEDLNSFLGPLLALSNGTGVRIINPQVQKGKGIAIWKEKYLPLLGVLAVAYEELSRGQLSRFANVEVDYVDILIASLRQFLDVGSDGRENRYRIYHASFSHYLQDSSRNRDYPLDGPKYHYQVASYYRGDAATWKEVNWDAVVEDYPFHHLTTHLAKSEHYDELYRLVIRGGEPNCWIDALFERFGTHEAFLDDVERVWHWAEDKELIAVQIHCALYHTTIRTWSRYVPANLIGLLVRVGRFNIKQAIAKASAHTPDAQENAILEIAANLPKNTTVDALSLLDQRIDEFADDRIKQKAKSLVKAFRESKRAQATHGASSDKQTLHPVADADSDRFSGAFPFGGSFQLDKLRPLYKDFMSASPAERRRKTYGLLYQIGLLRNRRKEIEAKVYTFHNIRDLIPIEDLPQALSILRTSRTRYGDYYDGGHYEFGAEPVYIDREAAKALAPRIAKLSMAELVHLIQEFKKTSERFHQAATFAELARFLPLTHALPLAEEALRIARQIDDNVNRERALWGVASYCAREIWTSALESIAQSSTQLDVETLKGILPNLSSQAQLDLLFMASKRMDLEDLANVLIAYAPSLDTSGWENIFLEYIESRNYLPWKLGTMIHKLAPFLPDILADTLEVIAEFEPIGRHDLIALATHLPDDLMPRAIEIANSIFLDQYEHYQKEYPRHPLYPIQELLVGPIEISEYVFVDSRYPNPDFKEVLERHRYYQVLTLAALSKGLSPELREEVFHGVCELLRERKFDSWNNFLAAKRLHPHLNQQQQQTLKDLLLTAIDKLLDSEYIDSSFTLALPILNEGEISEVVRMVSRALANLQDQEAILGAAIARQVRAINPKLAWQILSRFLRRFTSKPTGIVQTLVEIFPYLDEEQWPEFIDCTHHLDGIARANVWTGIAPHVMFGHDMMLDEIFSFLSRNIRYRHADQIKKVCTAYAHILTIWRDVDEDEAYFHWKLLLRYSSQEDRQFLLDMLPSLMPLALSFSSQPQSEAKKVLDEIKEVTTIWA